MFWYSKMTSYYFEEPEAYLPWQENRHAFFRWGLNTALNEAPGGLQLGPT